MRNKISLTESQFLTVANAARAIAPTDQAGFFEPVADQLQGCPMGDGSVFCAIRIAQSAFPHPDLQHAPAPRLRKRA